MKEKRSTRSKVAEVTLSKRGARPPRRVGRPPKKLLDASPPKRGRPPSTQKNTMVNYFKVSPKKVKSPKKDKARTEEPTEIKAEKGETSVSSSFACETCDRIFSTQAGMKRHSNKCSKGAEVDATLEEMVNDARIPSSCFCCGEDLLNCHLEGDFECTVPGCGMKFKQNISLDKHKHIIHEFTNLSFGNSMESGGEEESQLGMQDEECFCCGEKLETAHVTGDLECYDCSKKFIEKSSIIKHIKVMHTGQQLSCPHCLAQCPDKGTLARHMFTHAGKPYSCPICKQEFSRKYHLVRHNMQTGCDGTKRPVFPCQVCGREFNRKDNLREHLRAHAGQTKRKKVFTCDRCGMEFCGTSLLATHKRSHTGEKPYSCDFCPKRFSTSGALKKHRRTHTGERPYECDTCHKRFGAKETLNRHVRIHTGYKPHCCQFCGKSFVQSSQLKSHLFYHTGQSAVQANEPLPCEFCGKKFNRRARLNEHVKFVHMGAKPFECPTCSKTFIRKEDLNRHLIIHTGVKAHKCPICEKAFAMKSSLKVHLLTHTKEPPRSCDECGRAFIRQDCLLRHMRTKHRDTLEEIMSEAEKKKLQQQLLQVAAEANQEEKRELSEDALSDCVRELLSLLVDESTLESLGYPQASVHNLLEAVIRRCGHEPACGGPMAEQLRHNVKLLFTVVIDDSAVKALLNNQTVDEVILHVLRLAKS